MIERLRLDIDDEPPPEPMPEPSRQRKPHARINNNLLNRPLARDSRVHADWTFSKKHDRYWCDLPGTKFIRYRLPSDAELRIPDAFDVAVLFLILCEARMIKSRKVKFASRSAMLKKLGYPVRVRNRHRLDAALMLWSQLSIRCERWYREAQYERRGGEEAYPGGYYVMQGDLIKRVKTREPDRITLVLPPPIERLRASTLYMVVDKAWLDHGKYESKVYFPLPLRAAVQNLVLAILANRRARRSMRSWCRTAGLNHSKRNARLRKLVPEVSRWFKLHKNEAIRLVEKGGLAWFISMDPRLIDDEEGGSTTPDLEADVG